MSEKDISRAPWTEQQVANLRARQEAPLHPYTCNGHPETNVHHKTVTITPTVRGLVCPTCGWVQTWAHAIDIYVPHWWEHGNDGWPR